MFADEREGGRRCLGSSGIRVLGGWTGYEPGRAEVREADERGPREVWISLGRKGGELLLKLGSPDHPPPHGQGLRGQ